MTKKQRKLSWQKWYQRKGREYYRQYYKKRSINYFRNWRKQNQQHLREWYKNYNQDPEHKISRNAKNAINNAIYNGKIKKQNYCSYCDSQKNIEKHHPNYSEPFSVIWLCRKCHRKLHFV